MSSWLAVPRMARRRNPAFADNAFRRYELVALVLSGGPVRRDLQVAAVALEDGLAFVRPQARGRFIVQRKSFGHAVERLLRGAIEVAPEDLQPADLVRPTQ
jgi:hypothetical protein